MTETKRKYSKLEVFLLEQNEPLTVDELAEKTGIDRVYLYSVLGQIDAHDDVKLIKGKAKSNKGRIVNSYMLKEKTAIENEDAPHFEPQFDSASLSNFVLYKQWDTFEQTFSKPSEVK